MQNRLPAKENLYKLYNSDFIFNCYDKLTSTMDFAREMAGTLSLDGYGLVTANSQTAGRGRQGRSWVSEESGFYGTFVFNSSKEVNFFSGLSLAVGCILCDVCESYGCELRLKWPNDLLTLNASKLAGVLIELIKTDKGVVVLVGIGVNLDDYPKNGINSDSLNNITGKNINIDDFTIKITRAFRQIIDEFLLGGFLAFKDRWLTRALWYQQKIKIKVGTDDLNGIFADITDSGSLVLNQDGKYIEIYSGELVY